MSLSNGNGTGGGPGEPIPRYLNPQPLGGTCALPDRRRRGKNLGGNYYGSNGPRSDAGGRYQGGGSGYQRSHRGGGGSGDGPHNGTSGYHIHRGVGDYDPQHQQHSPTDSHGSGRSSSHHHQGSVNHSSGGNHHYQHAHHPHHQYHKQDYDGVSRHEYRSQRGSAGGGGDQHHHNQHHHHHHANHYNSHHHRISVQTQQQQQNSDGPTSSGHPPQSSHSTSGFGVGNSGAPSNGHQSMSASVGTAEPAVIPQPPQPPPEHAYPPAQTTNCNGAGHYQQQSGQHVSPATMIQQFPAGMPAAGPATTTVGFYGYHPNSQPMFGSLALCHIPYGVNPSSVISPIVYTQIIGSGMLTPGLPYNLTCGIPTQFLQSSNAAPMILQPPQQHLQSYPHQPHYHHHYHPHPSQFAGGHSLQAANLNHHQTTNQNHHQHNQGGGVVSGTSGDDCVLFDSSSLLNPDADAFFPPAFPPSEGDVAEMSGDLGNGEDGNAEEQIVVVDEDELKTERKETANVDMEEKENFSQSLISNNSQEAEDSDDECENGDDDGENENSKCNTSETSKVSGAGDDNEVVVDDMSWG